MRKFDKALIEFERACENGKDWKANFGAAYRTRLDTAFHYIKLAYEEACRIDDGGDGDV